MKQPREIGGGSYIDAFAEQDICSAHLRKSVAADGEYQTEIGVVTHTAHIFGHCAQISAARRVELVNKAIVLADQAVWEHDGCRQRAGD